MHTNRTTTTSLDRSVFARGDKEKVRRRRVHHHRVRFEQLESRLLLVGDPCEPNADSGEGGTVSSGVHVCASAGGPELTEVTIDEGESASFTIHHTDGDGDPTSDPSSITVGYNLLGSSAVLDVDYDPSLDLQVAFDSIDVPWNGSVTINIDTLLDDLIEGVENVRFNLVQVPNNGPQSADILINDTTEPVLSDVNSASNSVAEGAGNGTDVGITLESSSGAGTTYSLSDDAGGMTPFSVPGVMKGLVR